MVVVGKCRGPPLTMFYIPKGPDILSSAKEAPSSLVNIGVGDNRVSGPCGGSTFKEGYVCHMELSSIVSHTSRKGIVSKTHDVHSHPRGNETLHMA